MFVVSLVSTSNLSLHTVVLVTILDWTSNTDKFSRFLKLK